MMKIFQAMVHTHCIWNIAHLYWILIKIRFPVTQCTGYHQPTICVAQIMLTKVLNLTHEVKMDAVYTHVFVPFPDI